MTDDIQEAKTDLYISLYATCPVCERTIILSIDDYAGDARFHAVVRGVGRGLKNGSYRLQRAQVFKCARCRSEFKVGEIRV